jgi:thiol-disulfide isomerase/thioredoxin
MLVSGMIGMIRSLTFVVLALTMACSPLAAAPATYAPILRATDWLNGRPQAASLANRVVIVDVFTYDCINCQHVVPALRSLYARTRRSDVAIIGIHTPENPYERVRPNVVRNLQLQGIVWPVAIDNDQHLWDSYEINAWPTQVVFDRHGRLRQEFVGEGYDANLSALVKQLIAER